jgi:alpha-tubulin suppressor-like RCC1 family protein
VTVTASGALAGITISKIAVSGLLSMALGANKIFFWGIFAMQTSGSTTYAGFDGTNGATSYKNAPYAMSMSFLGSKTIDNIFCGPSSAFVLTSDGYVFGIGYNGAYQLDPGSTAISLSNSGFGQAYGLNPNTLNAGEYVTSIIPNAVNTAVITNKRAYMWGQNTAYQITQVPLSYTAQYPVEIIIPGNKVTKIFTNNMPSSNPLLYFYAVLTDGCDYPTVTLSRDVTSCVGGTVYYSTTTRASVPYNSGMTADRKIIDMQTNGGYYEGYALFLTSAGRVYSLGGAENGRVGDGTTTSLWTAFKTVSTTVMNTFIVAITAGYTSAGALSSDNQFYIWGYSSFGETTDGEGNGRVTPVLGYRGEIGSRIILDIQGGMQRFGVLTADGRVFLWGSNNFGMCFR